MIARARGVLVALVLLSTPAGAETAGARSIDAEIGDWCFGVSPGDRIEDGAARLACGFCQGAAYPLACLGDHDCYGALACSGNQEELVWYDARTDGAVNDLRAVGLAQDRFALYVVVGFHTYLDPSTLPNVQIAIDAQAGGGNDLFDPHTRLVAPGVCSGSSDRACTRDEDCHFCSRSFEAPPCCQDGTCTGGEICRVRTCGSGCNFDDPQDLCDTSQTCLGLGTTALDRVGLGSNPLTQADYLVSYDFGRLFLGASEAVRLSRWNNGWTPVGTSEILIAPGIPERPPPLSFETAIAWSTFGCTNWTEQDGCGAGATAAGCGCPDFGPGTLFGFTTVVSRAEFTGDYSPWGAVEDVASEAVAGTTTLTGNDCPGPGIGTTACEVADGSHDAFAPRRVLAPGGAVRGLKLERIGPGPAPSVALRWNPSCSYGDTDFTVYRGDLDALPVYDHQPVLCSTAGVATATLEADPGDRYYLVVPTDGDEEGSHGVDAGGTQRPPAVAACRGQVATFACP